MLVSTKLKIDGLKKVSVEKFENFTTSLEVVDSFLIWEISPTSDMMKEISSLEKESLLTFTASLVFNQNLEPSPVIISTKRLAKQEFLIHTKGLFEFKVKNYLEISSIRFA